ncbi:c-type cytochrome [Oscillochloris sp. ZM17-4]|nr:c-type cytochrome [Oscillochloris sp. ZM17-4]
MMAPWGKTLDPDQITSVVAFLQHWDEISAAGVALTAPVPVQIDLGDAQAVLALGERLFTSTCTSCHGEAGSGGIGPAINSQQFLSRKDDAAITLAIVQGGQRPGSAMPAFGDRLTSVEIGAIVTYIRSLEATAPNVANPRGTEQGGGGPPWMRATPTPDPSGASAPESSSSGRGGGPPPWAGGGK